MCVPDLYQIFPFITYTLLLQLGLDGLYFISVITDYCFMYLLYAFSVM